MTDLDDLLGESDAPLAPPPKKRGRPSKADLAARAAYEAAQGNTGKVELPAWESFYQPVSMAFLAKVFRMETKSIAKKLMKCPIVDHSIIGNRGRPVPRYDFVEAASYLVPPKVDLVQYLTSLNSNNIPPHINKTFWDAMNAKAKWMANAKQTWHDEDVLEVLGTTAIKIRETTMLWVDELPDKVNISNENYLAIRGAVADLLKQIKDDLIELPKKRRTESVVASMDDELNGKAAETMEAAGEWEPDEDDEDLLS